MGRVAVDAMGGDYAPREVVLGAIAAAESDPTLEQVLVGVEDPTETVRQIGRAKDALSTGRLRVETEDSTPADAEEAEEGESGRKQSL